MSHLNNSTSILAYQHYWRTHPPQELAVAWMMLCFPFEAAYVRLVSEPATLSCYGYYGQQSPLYVALDQFRFSLVAVASTYRHCVQAATEAGYTVMAAH